MLEESEINAVYLKLEDKFKLNLKSRMKGTGLFFEKFLSVTDIITNKNYFALILNSKILFFDDLLHLNTKLERIIKSEIREINEQVESLQNHRATDLIIDKAAIHYELDELGDREDKLYKLLEQLKKNIGKTGK
jgi:hypothetical protein